MVSQLDEDALFVLAVVIIVFIAGGSKVRIEAMRGKQVFCSIFLALLVTSFTAFRSFAAEGSPSILNYQGTLSDDAGKPVTATKPMSFKIYDGPAATVALWDSGSIQVQIVNGLFSQNLGPDSQDPGNLQPPFPPNLFMDDTRYIGVTVDGTELSPRKKLVSVPYALNAGSGIPKGGIIMWSGGAAEIPQGWALCDGENGTPDLRDKFVVGAGNTYTKGDKGGSSTKDLSHVHATGSHTLTIDEMPSHGHAVRIEFNRTPETSRSDGEYAWNGPPYGTMYSNSNFLANTGGGGAHDHGSTTSAGNITQDILPPYYALCFIMKR